LALVVAGAACSAERPKLADEESATSSTTASTVTSESTTTTTEPDGPVEVATVAGDSIEVFADATATTATRTITSADATSAPGIPLVFLVRDRSGERIEVDLPVTPPGSTGWVREADVSVATVPYRIEIALPQHRFRVYKGETLVLDEPFALGADRPAAGEELYVKELLQPPDGSGPYGAYAYGLSGYATSLASFSTGTGLVGIHGHGDPATLGQDVPSGSIHLTDELIGRLVNEIGLPLGTPVHIVG
jgi:hypothetical protein